MRIQVRIGEQYKELQEYLEPLKPDLRGKRLLALALMQLAVQKAGGLQAGDKSVEGSDRVSPETVSAPKTEKRNMRVAPSWIKENAST